MILLSDWGRWPICIVSSSLLSLADFCVCLLYSLLSLTIFALGYFRLVKTVDVAFVDLGLVALDSWMARRRGVLGLVPSRVCKYNPEFALMKK